MKIKRYTITENKKINNDYLKKYVTENDISQNEIAKNSNRTTIRNYSFSR